MSDLVLGFGALLVLSISGLALYAVLYGASPFAARFDARDPSQWLGRGLWGYGALLIALGILAGTFAGAGALGYILRWAVGAW